MEEKSLNEVIYDAIKTIVVSSEQNDYKLESSIYKREESTSFKKVNTEVLDITLKLIKKK